MENIILEPKLQFSYSQFFIYDSAVKLPGCDWTEAHSNQGFARRKGVINVGTLLEFGSASVSLSSDVNIDLEKYDRVIMVPITSESGCLLLNGVEEDNVDRKIKLDVGFYNVTIAQKEISETEEVIDIFIEKLNQENQTSKILLAESKLNFVGELIETVAQIG